MFGRDKKEDAKKEDAKKAPALDVPTVETIMKAEDCSKPVAAKIQAGQEALLRERSFRDFAKKRKNVAHYVCSAKRPTGYWRVGRKFGTTEEVVFLDELTEEQVAEMEATDPAHMKVEKVGFKDSKKSKSKKEKDPPPSDPPASDPPAGDPPSEPPTTDSSDTQPG